MLRCTVCNKEDYDYNLEPHGLDGDFIHKKGNCKQNWENFCDKMDVYSDLEFSEWITDNDLLD